MGSELISKKILIFIVAYNAGSHLEKVLDRIPPRVLDYAHEILIIDDASQDETFALGKRYQQTHGHLNLKVLYNPENQGYGGNQKLGYWYAIKHGFDAVVLLHGDGQYAPELLEEMFLPILKGEADAVFGSRMLEKGRALKGRMPLYKYAGNKALTFVQNRLLGTKLSEFHSGYRAYSVKALAEIPFQRNSDDFHFDTQIIIQLLLKKFRIKEIPIPTYYGTELCRVNGIRYAWNVLKSTLLSRLHRLSIFYQREFDVDDSATVNISKLGYTSSHSLAVAAVPPGSRVLELGSSQRFIAQALQDKGCTVAGLALDDPEKLPPADSYDHILVLDVLEHLSDPEKFLDILRERTKRQRPKVIITTPNVAFWVIRWQLLFSNFNYGKQGILDLTHKRLFTFRSLQNLCASCGYTVKKVQGIPAPFPKALGRNWFSMLLLHLNEILIRLHRSLFSYQIYLEAVPQPVVSELLEYSIKASAERKV